MTIKRDSTQRYKDRATISRGKPNCHICGAAINYTLKWPDKMCFVVDHVIPLHKGGADKLDNKKAAHAGCNSTKRARMVAPIVRRSPGLNRPE